MTRTVSTIVFLLIITLLFSLNGVVNSGYAQDGSTGADDVNYAFDFTEAVQPSTSGFEELAWNEGIYASHYGPRGNCWGGYGNRINPSEEFFVALPAKEDSLDCLGGLLGCKMSRCGDAVPYLEELLNGEVNPSGWDDTIEYWPGDINRLRKEYTWVIEGDEGDGLFRVLEIKRHGTDGPILEAYAGDVGPWNQYDPYWVDGNRPDAEDGTDMHGRHTNRAGIDLSYALAQELGFTGIAKVDWRWKTVRGAYVVRRKRTAWKW